MKKLKFAAQTFAFGAIAVLFAPVGRKSPTRRVYLSGPISGLSVNEYMRAFRDAELAVREGMPGVDVVSPTSLKPFLGVKCWTCYMVTCAVALAKCDDIYMLEGYRRSRGARIERHLAVKFGIRVLTGTYGRIRPVADLATLSKEVAYMLTLADPCTQHEALTSAKTVMESKKG